MRYIHQLADRPRFTWDDSALNSMLASVRHRQGVLLGQMKGLGVRFRSDAALENLVTEVTNSSAIEVTRFDPAAVRSPIARCLGIQSSASDSAASGRDVEGAVDMMLDATQGYAEPLTVNRLLGWQASLFPGGRSGLQRVLVGQWRTPDVDPLQIVSGPILRDRIRRKNIHFEASTAGRVPAEVERFLEWFEKPDDTDPVSRAGRRSLIVSPSSPSCSFVVPSLLRRSLRFVRYAADAASVTISEQLCLACGLCCDGTLFDNVRLEAGDDARQLKALGLPVKTSRGREPVARFPQPCAALCKDRTCRVYASRPAQCRTYECMVYKEMNAGRIDFPAALRQVTRARRQADTVRKLLRKLGDADEQRSLGERFHNMQCRMESDAPDPAALATFADLSLAVHRLKLLAHAKFFTRP